MPIPLHRMPFIVLRDIYYAMEPRELIALSFTDQNVEGFIKKIFKQRQPTDWRVFSTGPGHSRLQIAKSHESPLVTVIEALHIAEAFDEPPNTLIYKRGFWRGVAIEGHMTIYFEDMVMGSAWIEEYVTTLFNVDGVRRREPNLNDVLVFPRLPDNWNDGIELFQLHNNHQQEPDQEAVEEHEQFLFEF
ncbi:unnamed protein product [Caenorhabditis nigoni]